MDTIHVVFGAAGGLGAAIVRKLAADGERVRAVVRDAGRAKGLLPESVEVVAADARDSKSTLLACRGASAVYHCVNAPYNLWREVLPMVTENILAAARYESARLMFSGNVYGYGYFDKLPVNEDHPRAALTRKGSLRNELEDKLLAAHHAGEVQVIIPRMPDFYGPNVTNKLYGDIFKAALAGKRAMWLGNAEVPHDLVFIDDAAAACVLLSGTDGAYGQVWHITSPETLTGREFLRLIYRAAGRPPRVFVVDRLMLRLGGLFDPVVRELLEILYLFEQPQVLDGTKFQHAFPEFRYTPHAEAVQRTLEWFRKRTANRSAH
jgi:nucleoside-diphosphate-sugar epimerase